LAARREEVGDFAGALALYHEAIDHGDKDALWIVPELLERTGRAVHASRMRRFGLTGAGDVATTLDFGSYSSQTAGYETRE
jgi:hypothetical protein